MINDIVARLRDPRYAGQEGMRAEAADCLESERAARAKARKQALENGMEICRLRNRLEVAEAQNILLERQRDEANAYGDDEHRRAEAAEARVRELETEIYVPGQWRCAKCAFTLQQANLNACTGAVTARDDAGDRCPNCDSPLWRTTWKQEAYEMLSRAEEQMERAKAAEARFSTIEAETIERCAKVAETEGAYPELNVWAGGPEWYRHGLRIAAAIRNLAQEVR